MESERVRDRIEDMAPIEFVFVPKEWRKEHSEPAFGDLAKSISFYPPASNGACLVIYDRGMPVADSAGDTFKQLLEQPHHELSLDEIDELGYQILGTVGDGSAFQIHSADTIDVTGKPVLRVTGEWITSSKKFVGHYFPEWGREGGATDYRTIREVYYEGGEPQFTQYQGEATRSMNTVIWTR